MFFCWFKNKCDSHIKTWVAYSGLSNNYENCHKYWEMRAKIEAECAGLSTQHQM